jgi:hypothetical protein
MISAEISADLFVVLSSLDFQVFDWQMMLVFTFFLSFFVYCGRILLFCEDLGVILSGSCL